MAISNPLPIIGHFKCAKCTLFGPFHLSLFGHGPFQTLHILHNPKLFDHRLLIEIDSLFPDPIPIHLSEDLIREKLM